MMATFISRWGVIRNMNGGIPPIDVKPINDDALLDKVKQIDRTSCNFCNAKLDPSSPVHVVNVKGDMKAACGACYTSKVKEQA